MQAHPPASTSAPHHPPHPLGPPLLRNPVADPIKSRIIAALLLVACAAPLVTAARLVPDPSGTGTHRQLGFPDCGVLTLTGVPCPTCGMTTAFAHAVRAQWLDAARAQPMGLALAVAACLGMLAALDTLLTGHVWAPNWYRISPTASLLALLLLFAAAWAYKIWAVAASA